MDRDPEQAAQLGPPRVQHLSLGQSGAAPGAASGQARARLVPGQLRVDDDSHVSELALPVLPSVSQ